MSDKKTEKKFAERRKRLDYYKRFTPEKLTELENKMGNIIIKYKKGKIIAVVYTVFSCLLLGVSLAFSFRYLVSFQEMLDYSGFFLLAPLQKFVDSLFFECGEVLRYVFAFLLCGLLVFISYIISVVSVKFMHSVKSIVLKTETSELVASSDDLERVILLKEKLENIYKFELEHERYILLISVSFIAGVVCPVLIGFSGDLKESLGKLILMLVITMVFYFLVTIHYAYKIDDTHSKYNSYRDERDEAVKILVEWRLQLDAALAESVNKKRAEERKRQEARDLEERMSKLKQKDRPGPDYIIVPRIDVSDV